MLLTETPYDNDTDATGGGFSQRLRQVYLEGCQAQETATLKQLAEMGDAERVKAIKEKMSLITAIGTSEASRDYVARSVVALFEGWLREEREQLISDIAEHNTINTFGKKGYNNLGLLLTAEYWQSLKGEA